MRGTGGAFRQGWINAPPFTTALGDLCFTPASAAPGNEYLFTVANTFWSDPTALIPAPPGPLSITITTPPQLKLQTAFQAIVQNGGLLARTNAVIVDLR